MAEAVAAALATEQVISTGLRAGVGYAVAKPTVPVKAKWSQIATTSHDVSRSSLMRSHHSVTVVGSKAYIFSGRISQTDIASTDVHSIALTAIVTPEYQVLPAIPAYQGGHIPSARQGHAACAHGSSIAVLVWDNLEPAVHPERVPVQRTEAKLFSCAGNLVLYGGKDSSGSALADTWHFDRSTKTWNQLPSAPVGTTSAALVANTLYLISNSDDLSGRVHTLGIKQYSEQLPTWTTLSFPTNPLTLGPKLRENGGLVPVTTGYGRNYLLYFFGDRRDSASGESDQPPQWSEMWTFQLPSSDLEFKAITTVDETIKPAKVKDQIRPKVGTDTGDSSWAEVELQSPGDIQERQGKAHPGPRSHFGYCQAADGRSAVMWGGLDAKGKQHGDGWVIQLE
ncbi:hypothetical protein DL766_004555 [Monosporascus sp. MC13-8B]|uniref:Galactose oxidase n=1 Tax=Monosporascus cannonballus TaxID=155416 RepID=A0ABY0HJV1_9PEZI|nr:hypothetical protein DL763_005743 [Monosporascus cannonballus]RYO94173.1 hypothetical protein DL762_000683 [Monosporascus cannonballus]RYP31125.1 hypothetical protein DL766_004555 [Monosporascus sp. MC13-8B]